MAGADWLKPTVTRSWLIIRILPKMDTGLWQNFSEPCCFVYHLVCLPIFSYPMLMQLSTCCFCITIIDLELMPQIDGGARTISWKHHHDSLQLGWGLLRQFPPFREFFSIVKTNVSYWISRLYLAGVAAAQLRWHLSNMNVIRRI